MMKIASPLPRCPYCSSHHVAWVHQLFSWHLTCHYCQARSKKCHNQIDAYRHWQLLAKQVTWSRIASRQNLKAKAQRASLQQVSADTEPCF